VLLSQTKKGSTLDSRKRFVDILEWIFISSLDVDPSVLFTPYDSIPKYDFVLGLDCN
jgi:hypothetical protein